MASGWQSSASGPMRCPRPYCPSAAHSFVFASQIQMIKDTIAASCLRVRELVSVLAGLGRGEALVLGEAVPLPTRLQFDKPNPWQHSDDIDFHTKWKDRPLTLMLMRSWDDGGTKSGRRFRPDVFVHFDSGCSGKDVE